MGRAARGAGADDREAAAPHHAVPRPPPAGKKGGLGGLLGSVFAHAQGAGLIERRPEASIDSTGLSATVRSAHYASRRRDGNRRYRSTRWPKLTVVNHNASHLIAAAIAGTGPSYDAPLFTPAMLAASWNLDVDRLLADGGYDAEPNHRTAREGLGVRSTVIALNRRGARKWPKQPYRRQMARRFHRRKYGQRWQAESVFSRLKRRLGAALRGRSDASRNREMHVKVLTHNLMILAGSTA